MAIRCLSLLQSFATFLDCPPLWFSARAVSGDFPMSETPAECGMTSPLRLAKK